jgi:ABC-type transporter Mla subunit MlaD
VKQKHIHYHFHLGSGLPAILSRLETIMTTVTEIAARVEAQTAQVAKIGEETRSLITKINDLTSALANAALPEDAIDALDALDAQLGIVDGLVADLPAPTPDPVP